MYGLKQFHPGSLYKIGPVASGNNMKITAVMVDETVSGEVVHTVRLSLAVSSMPVRDLIRERIQQEAARFNLQRPVNFRSLVYPLGCEETDKGFRLERHRDVNWEPQYQEALDAFEHHSLSIYIDNEPVKGLDDLVSFEDNPHISFVKLSPLKAG